MAVGKQYVAAAWRSITRTPALSAGIILTLTTGLALVATLFSFVNGFLYHPFPYPESDRVVSLAPSGTIRSALDALVATTRTLQSVTTYREQAAVLSIGAANSEISAVKVDTAFFTVLRSFPIRGRLPTTDEIRNGDQVVVVGEEFWHTRLGGTADVIGRAITIDGSRYTVVGIMPRWFSFPDAAQAWYPFGPHDRGSEGEVFAIGRLADNASPPDVEREVALVKDRLRAADSTAFRKVVRTGGLRVSPDMMDRGARFGADRVLWIATGAAGAVLLIACTNLAALMLARAARRRHEMVVRLSLGATPGQLVAQQVLEAILLATISCAAGLLLSVWGKGILVALLPANAAIPAWVDLGIDARVGLFTVGASLITVLVFGLWPALEALRVDALGALRPSMDLRAGATDASRALRVPVVLQVSVSIALFVVASLMVRSAHEVAADPGYSLDGLLSLRVTESAARNPPATEYTRFHRQLGERMRAAKGPFRIASISRFSGFGDSANFDDFRIIVPEDRRVLPDALTYPGIQVISDGYFDVLGVKMLSGRAFNPALEPAGPPTSVIVSRQFAMEVWGTSAVTGRQLLLGRPGYRVQVVGVIHNVKRVGVVNGRAALVEGRDLFISERQGLTCCNRQSYVVRTSAPPAQLSALASASARAIGHHVAGNVVPASMLRGSGAVSQMLGGVLTAFAAAGLLLAAVGLYGFIAFTVEHRYREAGIRIALGAQPAHVVRLLARDGWKLVSIGLVVGLVAAAAAGRLVSAFLVTSIRSQVIATAATAIAFAFVAAVACYIPARRSGAADPTALLRGI